MSNDWNELHEWAAMDAELRRSSAIKEAVSRFGARLTELGFFPRAKPFLGPNDGLGPGFVFRIACEEGWFGSHSSRLDIEAVKSAIGLRNRIEHQRAYPVKNGCIDGVKALQKAIEVLEDFVPMPVLNREGPNMFARPDDSPQKPTREDCIPAVGIFRDTTASLNSLQSVQTSTVPILGRHFATLLPDATQPQFPAAPIASPTGTPLSVSRSSRSPSGLAHSPQPPTSPPLAGLRDEHHDLFAGKLKAVALFSLFLGGLVVCGVMKLVGGATHPSMDSGANATSSRITQTAWSYGRPVPQGWSLVTTSLIAGGNAYGLRNGVIEVPYEVLANVIYASWSDELPNGTVFCNPAAQSAGRWNDTPTPTANGETDSLFRAPIGTPGVAPGYRQVWLIVPGHCIQR